MGFVFLQRDETPHWQGNRTSQSRRLTSDQACSPIRARDDLSGQRDLMRDRVRMQASSLLKGEFSVRDT